MDLPERPRAVDTRKKGVCHYPPGTSKWNKIEHRMFSRITQNRRGRPLISHEATVNLIANTTSTTGLKLRAALADGEHPLGVKLSRDRMEALRLSHDEFPGDWNYTLSPPDIARV